MSGKRSRLPRTKPADDGGGPWTDYDDRNHRRDRQRSSFQKGKRVRLAWHRPGRIYHRWQAKAARDSQTWELLLAKGFRARGSRRPAQSAKQSPGLRARLAQLTSRTHRNVAAVALANKLARMA